MAMIIMMIIIIIMIKGKAKSNETKTFSARPVEMPPPFPFHIMVKGVLRQVSVALKGFCHWLEILVSLSTFSSEPLWTHPAPPISLCLGWRTRKDLHTILESSNFAEDAKDLVKMVKVVFGYNRIPGMLMSKIMKHILQILCPDLCATSASPASSCREIWMSLKFVTISNIFCF